MIAGGWGKVGENGQLGSLDRYTLLYFNMDNQQGPTVQPWNWAKWYVVAWTTGEEFGG